MPTREIKLKSHDESEIFSPMDPDQMMVSDDVVDYLSRVFLNKHRRIKENYVLRIISDTPVDEEHVKGSIRREFEQKKDDIHYALKWLSVKFIVLAVLGAAMLCVWLYLSAKMETVGVEILSLMGWVCVWEATGIAILQRPELHREWLNLDRLTRAEIVIQTVNEESDQNDF